MFREPLKTLPERRSTRPESSRKIQCRLQRRVAHSPDPTCEVVASLKRAETRENGGPAGRPKRALSTRRRIRPGARFRPGVGGSRARGPNRPKCLFLQCFAVGRAFLQPGRSVSCFFETSTAGAVALLDRQARGQSRFGLPSRKCRVPQGLWQTRKKTSRSAPERRQGLPEAVTGRTVTVRLQGLPDSLIRPGRSCRTCRDSGKKESLCLTNV